MRKILPAKKVKSTKTDHHAVLRAVTYIMEHMATQEDVRAIRLEMATKLATRKHIDALHNDFEIMAEDIDSLKADVDVLKTDVAEIKKELSATKTDVLTFKYETAENFVASRAEMATKDHLSMMKEEIIERLMPTEQAVDTDATTIVGHERRITHLERQVAVA